MLPVYTDHGGHGHFLWLLYDILVRHDYAPNDFREDPKSGRVFIQFRTNTPFGIEVIPDYVEFDLRRLKAMGRRELAFLMVDRAKQHIKEFMDSWVDPRSPSAAFKRACKKAMLRNVSGAA